MILLKQICDDFFQIGKLAILHKQTDIAVYDFNFRNNFDCKSVLSETDAPILLHIGAIEDYEGLEKVIEDMGMRLLVSNAAHLRCSTIVKWYPVLKDKTPYTEIYDELPSLNVLLKSFSFPVFIKGNRQTNRHKRSQCIIENAEAYEALAAEWHKDPVLSWQKVAIRKYVPLKKIDDTTFPDMVPISYEFRFFYFEGRCVGYGPYWYMGKKYTLAAEDVEPAIQLGEWAASRVAVEFITVDLAKTATGEWIIIEVNDAQESGFVGVNPYTLWRQTIDAAQNRQWIPVDEIIADGAVIMSCDSIMKESFEEAREIIAGISSTADLIQVYAEVHNKFWFIQDEIYDYEEDTAEYATACKVIDAWDELREELQQRVLKNAEQEGLLPDCHSDIGMRKLLMPIMEKYGYRDGGLW